MKFLTPLVRTRSTIRNQEPCSNVLLRRCLLCLPGHPPRRQGRRPLQAGARHPRHPQHQRPAAVEGGARERAQGGGALPGADVPHADRHALRVPHGRGPRAAQAARVLHFEETGEKATLLQRCVQFSVCSWEEGPASNTVYAECCKYCALRLHFSEFQDGICTRLKRPSYSQDMVGIWFRISRQRVSTAFYHPSALSSPSGCLTAAP